MSNIPQDKPNRTPPYGGAGALAVYIHWPFCKSKCPYCDFNSHVREGVEQGRWRTALLKELDTMAAAVPERRVISLFFGGGTPSLMPPETAEALIDRVHQLWGVADDIEITLEANPTSVEAETFADFKRAGVNRVSLGVQSLRDEELKFLGREHCAKEALEAVERARQTFDRYSFDLIYARPDQTVADWERELSEALRYAGGHLSLYQLTIEENTAFHHAYKNSAFALPDEETSEALYRLTEKMMAGEGLPAYEVSNYARPGEESRHNLAYWQGREYVGVGPGAHGRISQDDDRIATQTIKSPERWLEQVEKKGHGVEVWQPLELRQAIEERVMMGLRLSKGIALEGLTPHINMKKREAFTAQGLLAADPSRLRATLQGRLVLNRLTAELLG